MHHFYWAFRSTLRKKVICAFMISGLLVASPSFAQDQIPPSTPLTDVQWQQLEKAIGERVNEIANSREFFEEVTRPVTIRASLDRSSNSVILELDESFGRYVGGLELEDMQGWIRTGLEDLTDKIPGFTFVDWRIGGRDMDYWFNKAVPLTNTVTPSQTMQRADADQAAKVVVAAGHGAYLHGKYGWTMQRERINGVLEDEITQDFAEYLAQFVAPSGVEAVRVRGGRVSLVHEPSGLPWRSVAARYFLENWRPENPEIWGTSPEDKDPQRERFQDIRSRPLYANFIGADAVVHIHTNASAPSATGTRVIVHPGREKDQKLAELTLCSMKESFGSDPRYASYSVSRAPTGDPSKGENRYAKVPSRIVEVGFHTNTNDAKLLQERDFQRLSMRGVAKGLRLFRDGASCAPFLVQEQPPFTANLGKDAWMSVSLSGNPVYPVDIRATQLHCGQVKCRTKAKMVHSKKEADAYRFNHLCWRGDEKGPVEFTVEARDLDGVWTPSVTYQVKCVKPG
ncbi:MULTISPECIES: N-acetylmuramoyl-L-alanine amidase [Luteibacter]|uniref:N-acetylmuramoyl-L-alanine amidase n=1 Tax=Luteibacter TaxID=242605 RepID=UPI00068B5BFC|nr:MULTISPECIES: N-acetylmuramoyl-L-alanine amidase [unclassified Luteibacter]